MFNTNYLILPVLKSAKLTLADQHPLASASTGTLEDTDESKAPEGLIILTK